MNNSTEHDRLDDDDEQLMLDALDMEDEDMEEEDMEELEPSRCEVLIVKPIWPRPRRAKHARSKPADASLDSSMKLPYVKPVVTKSKLRRPKSGAAPGRRRRPDFDDIFFI